MAKLRRLAPYLLIGWAAFVYAFHYWTYYGPRVIRFVLNLTGR
jgi:hypothetical protein